MEKRVLVAFALALLVIIGHSRLMARRYPRPEIPEQPAGIFEKEAIPAEEREVFPALPRERFQMQHIANEEVITYETEKYEILISSIGGAIKEIRLKGYPGVDDQERMKLAEVVSSPGMLSLVRMNGKNLAGAVYSLTRERDGVSCRYLVPEKLEVVKRYYFPEDKYHIELEVKIRNLSARRKEYQYHIVGGAGIDMGGRLGERFVEVNSIINGELQRDSLRRIGKNGLIREGEILWTGLKNRYFAIILKPLIPAGISFSNLIEDNELQTGIGIAPFSVSAGSSVSHRFLLYAGPKDYGILKSYNFRFEEIINFGVFGGISKLLLATLRFFYRLVGNWGASIILLTLSVSVLLYPLTGKSMKSMREMQAIQPETVKLRETYKDNPQKLNREIMGLYRKHKINPLGGCLPMLFQMPIFIALYQALSRSIELKGAHFLWIKDLSLADALPLPFSLPVLGNTVNILPLLMSGAMFVQQKISQPGGHAQTEQQKQMAVFMPVLFGIMFYGLPSGLVLYWLTNTVLMITYQIIAKRGHL